MSALFIGLKYVSLKDVGLKYVSLKDVGLKDVSLKDVVVPFGALVPVSQNKLRLTFFLNIPVANLIKILRL